MRQPTLIAEPVPEVEQDTLEVLLRDRHWVEAEFAAIMRASGFDDRLVVGTIPSPRFRNPFWTTGERMRRPREVGGFRPTKRDSRVRSPPENA